MNEPQGAKWLELTEQAARFGDASGLEGVRAGLGPCTRELLAVRAQVLFTASGCEFAVLVVVVEILVGANQVRADPAMDEVGSELIRMREPGGPQDLQCAVNGQPVRVVDTGRLARHIQAAHQGWVLRGHSDGTIIKMAMS